MADVKQIDLAKLWGLSRQRVSQYVKAGMPLDSVEAATRWRAERYGGNAGKFLQASLQVKGGALPPPPKAPRKEDLARVDVHGVYARLIEAERQGWDGLADAMATGDMTLIRTQGKVYSETVRMRLTAEKDVLAIMRERGDLVPGGMAAEAVGRVLAGIRVLLLAMPNRLAARVNPEDPDLARSILAEEVAATMARMRGIVDGDLEEASA